MSKNQPQIPMEGDLLFKKTSGLDLMLSFLTFFGIITISYLINILKNGFLQVDLIIHIGGILFTIGFIFISIILFGSLKEGIKNETYEGFYFPDKLILYRISNYVDEIYTEKKSKETLLKEIIELKDKISKQEYVNDNNTFSSKVFDEILVERKEKGVIIADNLRKPHKTIVEFKEIGYFLSEKGGIKVVLEHQKEDSSDSNYFYSELTLTEKYRKNQPEIVEFLNKRVQESKKNTST